MKLNFTIVIRVVFFSLFCCSFITMVNAQQRPYYTQYILNNYLVNPAVAGIENYTDVKLSHRHQWVGLNGAPVTTYFTIHGPLKRREFDVERENPTTFSPPGRNAMLENYQAPDAHHGIGFTMLNDKTGPLNRFAAYGTYAYHLPISKLTTLSFGVSAGITQLSLRADELNFDTPGDQAVYGSGKLNQIKPDISAGLWLYSKNYFIGFAAQQILPEQIDFSNNIVQEKNGRLVPHMFATAGFRVFLDEDKDFSLLPSIMLRYINPLPLGVDVNVKLQYQDKVWIGANYRHKEGYAGMLGINLSSVFNIGYSYDITTSALNNVSRGSHELLLGFLIGNRYNDYQPHNLW